MEVRMSTKSIEWRMQCAVNGESFEFNGTGRGDSARGQVQLNLKTTGFPDGFEPVSCPLICNAPISIGFARNDDGLDALWNAAGGLLNVEPARVGAVFDSRGAELLRLSVSSVVSVKGDTVIVGNEMKGFSHLPALEKTLAPTDEFIIPNGPGAAISSVRFKMLAKSGEILTGMTLVPYRWEGNRSLQQPIIRRYEAVDVQWDGGFNVVTTVRSVLLPLHAQPRVSQHAYGEVSARA
jgi:hypothetical protein